MKAYRKPSGHYIELMDHTPVSESLVQVAPRPSPDHAFSDTWQTDPMNPTVCWRLKNDQEQELEKESEFDQRLGDDAIKKILFKMVHDQENRIRKLEGKKEIPIDQFKLHGRTLLEPK